MASRSDRAASEANARFGDGDRAMSGPSSPRRSTDNDLSSVGNRTPRTGGDLFAETGSHSDAPRVKHVQKEWAHRNFYVPETLDDALESVRAEIGESVEQEFGGQMAVTRHFYPVMIKLGLAQLSDLSPAEFAAEVDTIPGVDADEFTK